MNSLQKSLTIPSKSTLLVTLVIRWINHCNKINVRILSTCLLQIKLKIFWQISWYYTTAKILKYCVTVLFLWFHMLLITKSIIHLEYIFTYFAINCRIKKKKYFIMAWFFSHIKFSSVRVSFEDGFMRKYFQVCDVATEITIIKNFCLISLKDFVGLCHRNSNIKAT